jgi:hypothetical protein
MRIGLKIVGVMLAVFAGVWFLQGMDVFPAGFMAGQIRWEVYGGIAVALGMILLLTAARKRGPGPLIPRSRRYSRRAFLLLGRPSRSRR